MSIWSFIAAHPSDILTAIGFLAGAFGVNKVVKKRAATLTQIERWASTAAGLVVMLVKQGVIKDSDELISKGVQRFEALVKAAGVEVSPKHEIKALTVITEAVTAAGQAALKHELETLGATADAAIKRMEALTVKSKKPTTVVK